MKTCSRCKKDFPATNDFFHKKGNRLHSRCKECCRLRNKNPKRIAYTKNRDLMRLYGITTDKYNKMFSDQNGCCAICETHICSTGRSLAVDHDHETGKVRGLLCSNCNTALGKFKDNKLILQKAIDYLNHHDLQDQ